MVEKLCEMSLTRRQFFLRSAQALTTVFLAPSLLQGCGSSSPDFVFTTDQAAPTSLEALARSLDGALLRPGGAEFTQAALPWNLRYAARQPLAVARCQTVPDIARSLAWAQSNGVPFVIRSGGHSYSGFSTTAGLMIDISGMRGGEGDLANQQVTVGPGARNITLYDKLEPLGRAVTHGRCQNVGVAGLTMGGGIGFAMRLHGLTCDQLVETDLMLANGEILTLNENQNADLFWAVRGAGAGNFGIHTSMTFQTFPVDRVVAFNIDFDQRFDELSGTLMGMLSSFPRELGLKFSILVQQRGGVKTQRLNLLGQFFGSPGELSALLAPLTSLVTPSRSDITEVPYWHAQRNILGEEGAPEYSFERSRYTQQPLDQAGIQTVLERLNDWPGLEGQATWKLFLAGGAISDVAPEATAYVHRQALGITAIDLEWHEPQTPDTVEVNRQWLDEFHTAMAAFTSRQSYQNFIDERQDDYLRAYYGANLERLVEVKRRYDPGNVFTYPQGIPLSLG